MFLGRRSFFKSVGALIATVSRSGPKKKETDADSDASGALPSHSPESASSQLVATDARGGEQRLIRRNYDLVVVGGGIAGTTCAISAARNKMKVALVHNRPMLGGNSSSEVKLYPEDNSGHQPWIKEGGIHDEFHVEERQRNHLPYREGIMNAHWDLVLYEWAVREPNLTLYLNTQMHHPNMRDAAHIQAVYCIQLGTEKDYELAAPLFVDATGDGVLGFFAKADHRWGREAASEFNESLAPREPNDHVMGNTLFFRAVDTGKPVPFQRPQWAAEFPAEEDLTGRGHDFIDGGYWWIEVGMPHHPIHDNDKITHEALRQLLGVWDHIKNKCKERARAANYALEFVGFWPYKRECRRLLGDFVITERHVKDPQPLSDSVAYGTWGIDIHIEGGILTRDKAPYPPPRTDQHFEALGTYPYGIPLRALYSRNIENLFMAGRPISCSYVAFASSRVLSTGSIVGQAVGVAASLCKQRGVPPRTVAQEHIKQCQQLILRQDGHIPGVVNEDPDDIARRSSVTASSHAPLAFPEAKENFALNRSRAQLFPVTARRIERVELLLESSLAAPAELRLGLRPAAHVWDFRSTDELAHAVATVPPKTTSWVAFDLHASVDPNRLYYVYTDRRPGVSWKARRFEPGEPSPIPVGTTPADLPGKSRWRPTTGGVSMAMRLTPASEPYEPRNVVAGTNRPDTWTNIWISDPQLKLPAWLQLEWPQPVRFNTVQLTFDTDQNRRVILPLFRYPDCVRDYQLEVGSAAGWTLVEEVRDNYFRRRVHSFDVVETNRLRLTVLATNGAPSARLYEIRVYHEA